MSFAHPNLLLLLFLLPLLASAQVLARRRARRYAVRFPALPSLRAAMGASRAASWLRYLPAALLLGALASLVFALAKPQTTVAVGTETFRDPLAAERIVAELAEIRAKSGV